jgi:hypothetical protein
MANVFFGIEEDYTRVNIVIIILAQDRVYIVYIIRVLRKECIGCKGVLQNEAYGSKAEDVST